MGTLDLLSKAREFGLNLVQIGPNLPLDELPAAELEAVASQAKVWGIDFELATRGLQREHLQGQLELCERLNAGLLRTIPEVDGGRVATLSEIYDHLRAIIPSLAKAKVRLALENGKIPSRDMKEMVESVASPWVGITLDTVNSLAIPEGWREVATILAPYTMCLHVKDFIVQRAWHMMGFVVEGRPAGKGQLDIPWLLATLKSVGVTPSVVLEVWPPEQKTLQETIEMEQSWVAESIPYLRSLVDF